MRYSYDLYVKIDDTINIIKNNLKTIIGKEINEFLKFSNSFQKKKFMYRY